MATKKVDPTKPVTFEHPQYGSKMTALPHVKAAIEGKHEEAAKLKAAAAGEAEAEAEEEA